MKSMSLAGFVVALALSGAPVHAGSSEAYVTNQTGDSLTVVDLATLKAVAEVKIGGKPAGIAVAPGAGRAYLSAPDGHDIVVVDTAQHTVVKRLPVGQGPVGIAVNPHERPRLCR